MAYTKSQAQLGKGTVLQVGTLDQQPVYTEVAELDTLNQTGRQVPTEDTTNFDSSAKEFIPGLLDSGSWDFSGNRVGDDAGQVAMETAFQGLQVYPFKVMLPKTKTQQTSGDTFTFNGLIEKLNYSVGASKKMAVAGTIKVSGAITLTPGS